MKVSNYTMVRARDENELTIEVRRLLAEGWELYGSPCVGPYGQGWTVYIQAMIKP